jgi:myosin heavy subunit
MKKEWFVIGIMFSLVPWLMMGCGISQESYDTVVAQLNTAQQETQSVKTQLEASQSKVSELTSNLEKSQDELQLAQTNLKSTQDELDSTEEKLASIEKVYPPRQFSSSTELKEWLKTNDKSEKPFRAGVEGLYSLALELQEDALNDGYIISVDVDPTERANVWYITCVTCINGELWAWSPESDEITKVSTIWGWAKIP